ncbi:Rieske (2Fe-2S) protein [Streptomyces sp. NPDC058646]|uniref:Rieske (2Fe-2S) protein n=1 Tax=Streptomyces sp. NPDC058646 TaxID=3346574 RepID=UPI00365997EB
METSRRDVMQKAAAAGLAWAALGCAACPAAAATAAEEEGHSESPTDHRAPLAKTSEIPVGGGKIFPERNVLITQPVAGVFKAFSATCTHQGCALSGVSRGTADCPCHGSGFSIADGSVARGPATAPLASKRIRVADGSIHLV